jgi:hypothetical protein
MWKQKPAQIVISGFQHCLKNKNFNLLFLKIGRCRGCRNPHIPGGKKIRFFLSDVGDSTSNTSESSLVTQLNLPQYGVQRTSYSTSPQMSFEKVPSTLLVDDEKSNSGKSETLDIDI